MSSWSLVPPKSRPQEPRKGLERGGEEGEWGGFWPLTMACPISASCQRAMGQGAGHLLPGSLSWPKA